MLTQTFEYEVDTSKRLLTFKGLADKSLSKLCPVMVAKIKTEAQKMSSALIYVRMGQASQTARFGRLVSQLTAEELPEEVQIEIVAAEVFVAVAGSILGERYLSHTLNPELHAGDEKSEEWAKQQVAIELKNATRSSVNATSDGIA